MNADEIIRDLPNALINWYNFQNVLLLIHSAIIPQKLLLSRSFYVFKGTIWSTGPGNPKTA